MNAGTATTGTVKMTAVPGVACRRLHLPTSVAFVHAEGTEPRPYESRLEQLLLGAVADALLADGALDADSALEADGALDADGVPLRMSRPGDGVPGLDLLPEVPDGTPEGGSPAAPETRGTSVLLFNMAAPDTAATTPAPATPAPTTSTPATPAPATPAPATPAPTTSTPATFTPITTAPTAPTTSTPATSPPITTAPTAPATASPAPRVRRKRHVEAPAEKVERERREAERKAEEASTTVVVEERTGPPGDTPDERVVEGPSPLDGTAILVHGASQLVHLGEATRHVRSPSLMHTVQIGDHLFSAGSFAVLYGPLDKPGRTFWGVATTPTVTEDKGGNVVTTFMYQGEMLVRLSGVFVPRVVRTRSGERYGVEMVWTRERRTIYPSGDEAANWVQVKQSGAHRLSDEELAAYVFHDLDALVDAGLAGDDEKLEKAAAQLSEMSADTFALVGGEARAKYLRVLIKAWTFEERRHAILELMRSLDSMSELQAVRDRLIQCGLYEQLFADLGGELWALLTHIGKKFCENKPLTTTEFMGLIAEAFNLGTEQRDASLQKSVEQEETAVPGLKLWMEFEEIARAVAGFVLSTLDSFKLMLTEPEKIISALYHLARFIYLGHVARKDEAAKRELAEIRSHIGQAVVNGLRGAALLGVGPRVLTRIKWGVIIEALTWISEIKAVVGFLLKVEEIAAILRFLKLLKVLKASDAEVYVTRFTRLAAALHFGSAVLKGLKDEHEVAALLRMLPEEDGARLGAVLGEVDIREGSTLASLMEHPRLGPVVAEIRLRAELLHHLGRKAGGLTPELAAVFRRLAAADGFGTAELARIVEALPDGEGRRFAATVERIGFHRIGAKARVSAELLALLAGDARRMEAVREYGIDLVRKLHDRASGQPQAFDAMLTRLGRIKDKPGGKNAVEFAEFLERLRRDLKTEWRRVDPPPRKPRAPKEEVAAFRERTKELRSRFGPGTKANPKAFEEELKKLEKLAETDPERAAEHLDNLEEAIQRKASKEGQIAEVRAAEEARGATEKAKALYFEEHEAPAGELSVTTTLKRRLSTLRERASRALAKAMTALGMPQPPGHDAHHIIAWKEPSAAVAREILEWAGINPRDHPLNGVYLPKTTMDPNIVPEAWTRHQTLHTNNYYKETTRRLIEAKLTGGKDGVIRAMQEMKKELINGWTEPVWLQGKESQNVAQWLAENPGLLSWMTDEERAAAIARTTRPPRKRRVLGVRAGPGRPKLSPKALRNKTRKRNVLKRAVDRKRARLQRKAAARPAAKTPTQKPPAAKPPSRKPHPLKRAADKKKARLQRKTGAQPAAKPPAAKPPSRKPHPLKRAADKKKARLHRKAAARPAAKTPAQKPPAAESTAPTSAGEADERKEVGKHDHEK
ncbi:AHH domain-containing protein [Streptomyces virginiae]